MFTTMSNLLYDIWRETIANHKEYINLSWTYFLMIGNTYLKLKLLKRKIHFKALYHPYKGTRKVEDFYKLSYEE